MKLVNLLANDGSTRPYSRVRVETGLLQKQLTDLSAPGLIAG